MNIITHISYIKLITIIALATLFISTMSIREAQARHGVTCPCHFWAATLIAKSQARQIDGAFEIDECNLNTGVEAFGTSASTTACRIAFIS